MNVTCIDTVSRFSAHTMVPDWTLGYRQGFIEGIISVFIVVMVIILIYKFWKWGRER